MMYYTELLLMLLFVGGNSDKLRTVYEWKRLDFEYDEATKASHLKSGFYKPDVPAPIDADVFYYHGVSEKKRVFLTIPRFTVGSPITLGEVVQRKNKSPVLIPYPSIEWHDNPQKCKADRLLSVFRTKVDQCERLWVLDSGRYNDEIICPPQIIAFDMKTDTVVHKYEFSKNLYTKDSTFVTPTVEVRHRNCEDSYIYMADASDYTIVVYSTKSKEGWLVKDKTMAADPAMSTISIEGTTFELIDGIMGMDLGPKKWQNRKLYYTPLTGNKMSFVGLSNLRNKSLFKNNPTSPTLFKQYPTGRSSQSAGMSIDKSGIAYFGLMNQTSINCWNTQSKDFGSYISTVYANKETMQFASGVKVITKLYGEEELWVMTSRFQLVATGTLNFNVTNFRISYGKIPDIVKGTKCIRPNNA